MSRRDRVDVIAAVVDDFMLNGLGDRAFRQIRLDGMPAAQVVAEAVLRAIEREAGIRPPCPWPSAPCFSGTEHGHPNPRLIIGGS